MKIICPWCKKQIYIADFKQSQCKCGQCVLKYNISLRRFSELLKESNTVVSNLDNVEVKFTVDISMIEMSDKENNLFIKAYRKGNRIDVYSLNNYYIYGNTINRRALLKSFKFSKSNQSVIESLEDILQQVKIYLKLS